MSVYVTDDVSLWGYRYDTTGGDAIPVSGASEIVPDPTREYVSGGDGFSGDLNVPYKLPETIDDVTRAFGFKFYEAMRTHPDCFASSETLKLGIMAGEISLVETHPTRVGQLRPTPEQKQAADIKGFCQRLIDRVPGFRQSILQMYDCTWEGYKLGEMTGRIEEFGEDAGRMVLDTFHVKRRESFQFIVDKSMSVTGILTRSDTNIYRRIRPDKFVWFSWMPRDNDPRGRSILRAVYYAWNMSMQLYPQYFKALKQFAVASLLGVVGPDAKPVTVDGVTVTAEEYLLRQLVRFQNGSALAVPFGTTVSPIQVPGNGGSFLDAFNFFSQQIVYGMLLQTRATKEAQFGSRADAQQGGDILNLLAEYGRDMGSEEIRNRILKFYVALNFSKEVADIFTPYVYLGQGEPQDFVARGNMLANLYRAQAVTPSIKPELHAKCGIPVPDPEVDDALTPDKPVASNPSENNPDSNGESEDSGSGSDGSQEAA